MIAGGALILAQEDGCRIDKAPEAIDTARLRAMLEDAADYGGQLDVDDAIGVMIEFLGERAP